MRWSLLLLALAFITSAAVAQGASPLGLTNAIAYPWDALSGLVAPPDSGAVVDGEGHLVWVDLNEGVDRLDVVVRHGSIGLVTMTSGSENDRQRLATVVEQYAETLGPPADGTFYTASQLRSVNADAPYVDIAFDVERGQMVLRKPSAPPAAPPPPGR